MLRLRERVRKIVNHGYFEWIMIGFIIWSSITLVSRNKLVLSLMRTRRSVNNKYMYLVNI